MKILDLIMEKFYKIIGKWCYHRKYCRKQGKCFICGRPICSGCNATDKNGQYGICMICSSKQLGYMDKITVLPYKPLIKPKNIIRFENTVNSQFYGKI